MIKNKKLIKILIRVIKSIFISYLIVSVFLFFFQKNMLYFPSSKDFYSCEHFSDSQKAVYKWTRFYKLDWEKNNLIVFFHWNAGRACDRIFILDMLKETKNSILFVEYSWYAESNRQADLKSILKNVLEIWEYISSKSYDNVYVMWRSLWTWPASYFAQNFKTDKLFLVSPYEQLYKVAQEKYPFFAVKLLFTQNYNSSYYLKNYKNKLLIIHWKKDRVIPYKHALSLYNSIISSNKKILALEDKNHHNIFDDFKTREAIIEFLK